ncbi:hypothetical protein ACFQ08_32820, partial [Streptosporangium algeriense]
MVPGDGGTPYDWFSDPEDDLPTPWPGARPGEQRPGGTTQPYGPRPGASPSGEPPGRPGEPPAPTWPDVSSAVPAVISWTENPGQENPVPSGQTRPPTAPREPAPPWNDAPE